MEYFFTRLFTAYTSPIHSATSMPTAHVSSSSKFGIATVLKKNELKSRLLFIEVLYCSFSVCAFSLQRHASEFSCSRTCTSTCTTQWAATPTASGLRVALLQTASPVGLRLRRTVPWTRVLRTYPYDELQHSHMNLCQSRYFVHLLFKLLIMRYGYTRTQ